MSAENERVKSLVNCTPRPQHPPHPDSPDAAPLTDVPRTLDYSPAFLTPLFRSQKVWRNVDKLRTRLRDDPNWDYVNKLRTILIGITSKQMSGKLDLSIRVTNSVIC